MLLLIGLFMFGDFDPYHLSTLSSELSNDHELIDTILKLNEARDLDMICEIIDEYLQKNIKGGGCSIFLLDPTTNKLNIIYSKLIDKSRWGKAVYDIGEGFTGWVAKYKKFLYIKDETNQAEIKQIYPRPPIHAADKPHEIENKGPFMAAPILSRGSYRLDKEDFRDIRAFIRKLLDDTIPLSKFIKEKLGIHILNNLEDTLKKSDESIKKDPIIDTFIHELNMYIESDFLYEKLLPNEMRNISSSELKEILSSVPGKKADLIYINRLLLEEIFKEDLSKCYVLGVIRLPYVVNDKTEYTDDEQRLFKIFAIRLSQSIENANIVNKYDNLAQIYKKMGGFGDLKGGDGDIERLFGIVSCIPEIVGGGYCTIFKIDERNIYPKSTTSTSIRFLEKMRGGLSPYDLDGPCLTAWVAKQQRPLRIDDISNEKEIEKIDPNLIACRPVVEIDFSDVGPFLAVPIIKEQKSVGVIRVLRDKRARPFDSMDEILLTSSAALLSFVWSNIERNRALNDCQLASDQQFHNIFSSALTEKAINVSEISYAEPIRKFFTTPIQVDLPVKINDSLASLWKENYGMSKSSPLLEDFKNFENMLLELPGYRDHFIHQYQVFILGSIIIDEIYKIGKENNMKTFFDYYSNAIKHGMTKKQVDFAWLIAASFHDIAYPIERSEEVFNNFFSNFMGIDKKVIEGVRLDYLTYDAPYMSLIDNLSDFYSSLYDMNQWDYNGNDVRQINVNADFNKLIWSHLLEKRDHGVFSALILLHQCMGIAADKSFSTVIYPAALAICLHNTLLSELQTRISFKQNPLAFLLRFCDLTHEWGRSSNTYRGHPNLSGIDVHYDESDHKIYVSLEISLGDIDVALKKGDEAKKVFKCLTSNDTDIIFELKIHEIGKVFSSDHRQPSRRRC